MLYLKPTFPLPTTDKAIDTVTYEIRVGLRCPGPRLLKPIGTPPRGDYGLDSDHCSCAKAITLGIQ